MSRAAARAKAAPKAPAAEGTPAKAATYRPSKGRYPKRQFGHRRGFPKPTEEDITKILEANQVKLNRTKEIHVQYARRGPGNAGARNFKHEKIPIIKHWNPSVEFKVKMTETDPPQVTVLTEGNATETFAVEALRADAILELVVKHDQAQAKKAPKEAEAEKV